MTRRDAHVPRGLVARALGFEMLEDRWLLSSFTAPANSRWVNLAVENPRTAPFLMTASMSSPVASRAPESLVNITAGDGESSLAPVGLSKGTSEIAPPLYNAATLPSSIESFSWPGSAVGVAEASATKVDPGVAGVISAPTGSATVPDKIIVVVPGASTSDTTSSPNPTSGLAASASGSNEIWLVPSPIALLSDASSSTLSNSTSLAEVGDSVQIAKQVGSYLLQGDLPAGAVAVSSSGDLLSQTSSAVFTVAGGGGQAFISSGAIGFGGLLPVGVFAAPNAEFVTAPAIAFNMNGPAIQESTPPLVLGTPGVFFLSPLATTTANGFAKIAANGASGLGAAANLSNSLGLVGISAVGLAPTGAGKVSGYVDGAPAMDRTLTLAGRGVAQLPPFRDLAQPGNLCRVPTTHADPPGPMEEASPWGLAVPSPQRSDLIMDFMPFDQAAVGQTIDLFLQQLEDLGSGLSWFQGPMDVVVEVLAVAVALTTWKVVPKILGHSPADDDDLGDLDDVTSLEGISSLPGGSSPE